MEPISIIILIVLIVFVGAGIYNDIKTDKETERIKMEVQEESDAREEASQQEISRHGDFVKSLSEKYGEPTSQLTIFLKKYDYFDINERSYAFVDIFEKEEIIIFDNKEYKFEEILTYSIIDESTQSVTTKIYGGSNASTAGIVGRSVAGGILAGGAGAIIGGATAGRDISSTSTSKTVRNDDYTIYINLNNFSDHTISIRTFSAYCVQELANVLNIIINRNERRAKMS